MSENAPSSNGQGGQQSEPLFFGWRVLAIVAMSVILAAIANLLALALGVSAGANISLAGIIAAAIMVSVTAPRSVKQLAAIIAVVTAGGTLAIVATLTVRIFASGLWADLLGTGLAVGLGAGLILLFYRYLGVEYREPSSKDRT